MLGVGIWLGIGLGCGLGLGFGFEKWLKIMVRVRHIIGCTVSLFL